MALIGLDLRMVHGRLHGIARYALELARRLPDLAERHRFAAIVPPEGLPSELGPLTPPPSVRLVRARARFLSPLEQLDLPATLAALRPELFHATSFSMPALWPGKLVATLHDANHLALRDEYGVKQRAYYRVVVQPTSRRAKALVTDSEFSRRELSSHLGLSPERFSVIPLGVSEAFRPHGEKELAAFRARHSLPKAYFLAVGNEKAFKNLALLARVKLPLPLVLLAGRGVASRLGFDASKTFEVSGLDERELPPLYAGATALLLPSRYEGFGFPAIEAQASGCPVLYAQGTAVDEVCEGAGIGLSPDAPAGWEAAASRVLHDPSLRRELSEKGISRASALRWELCARRTLAVYERALGGGR